MTQVPRPVQTPSGGPVVATPPVDAPVGQQAGGNEALAKLRHTLMQQIWDSVPGRYDVDLLTVANGILGNPELLDALVAHRLGSVPDAPGACTVLATVEEFQVAEGWRPPAREITTAEVGQLPDGSVVLRDRKAWERDHGQWWHGGVVPSCAVPYGAGPITVLHIPTEGADQ